MNTLLNVIHELTGLFIDDGWLALSVSFVVALSAIIVALAPDVPVLAGIALLVGCLGALLANVISARTQ